MNPRTIVTVTQAVEHELQLLEQAHGITNRDALILACEVDRLPRSHYAIAPLCESLATMLLMLWPTGPEVTPELTAARDHRRAVVSARSRSRVS